MKSDAKSKNAVLATKHSVTLTVDEGVCTLTGTVPTDSLKFEVEDAVKRVWGVEVVTNELVIDIPRVHYQGDVELMEAVCDAVERCVVAPENIRVDVRHGNVVLSGLVPRQYQKEAVEDEIEKILGVKTIVNEIAIKP